MMERELLVSKSCRRAEHCIRQLLVRPLKVAFTIFGTLAPKARQILANHVSQLLAA